MPLNTDHYPLNKIGISGAGVTRRLFPDLISDFNYVDYFFFSFTSFKNESNFINNLIKQYPQAILIACAPSGCLIREEEIKELVYHGVTCFIPYFENNIDNTI